MFIIVKSMITSTANGPFYASQPFYHEYLIVKLNPRKRHKHIGIQLLD
jgi:hypothetical protein